MIHILKLEIVFLPMSHEPICLRFSEKLRVILLLMTLGRVGGGIAPSAPHRSGRAAFPHPAPRQANGMVSLRTPNFHQHVCSPPLYASVCIGSICVGYDLTQPPFLHPLLAFAGLHDTM